ncbi:MAG TPA: hypothetical protein PKM65_11370 [Spirochaetota bacterium]|nr:hypothetical protein [Spirochaetota bacterium]HNT09396.1 hypothetical protein [Spirochaetota bacterium]HNV46187.1 hypothetical protein [Spirochaetota bacterium]HOS39630.1 hypothetical protein [Spirochaetota bacterium]HPI23555.1 hypothetical protein [Spirochaetota bacterium]
MEPHQAHTVAQILKSGKVYTDGRSVGLERLSYDRANLTFIYRKEDATADIFNPVVFESLMSDEEFLAFVESNFDFDAVIEKLV